MNGPDHYREAELLIAAGEAVVAEIREVRGDDTRRDALGKQAMGIWAQAQVHATLALVGATVADRAIGPEETSGWHSFHADDQWREATS